MRTAEGLPPLPEPEPEISDSNPKLEVLRERLRTASKPVWSKRMNIRSKFEGTCRACGLPIALNQEVEWRKGHGALHLRCRAKQPS
jgi:hypothetical protein